jgi:hypothetical protein
MVPKKIPSRSGYRNNEKSVRLNILVHFVDEFHRGEMFHC